MQPLKIAVVVGAFPVVSQTFIVNQINALIDLGHHVQVFSYKKEKAEVMHNSFTTHDLLNRVAYFNKPSVSKIKRFKGFLTWSASNFKTIRWSLYFKTLNVFKYGKKAFTLHLFFESQWFLTTTDFDIIHAHFGPYASRIAYLKSNKILPEKMKLVATFHGYDMKPNKIYNYKKEYKLLLNNANLFTVNTAYLKNLLLEVKADLKNINILPVGLDTTYFRRQKIKEDNKYFDIVFCGRLIPLKGPQIAIDIVNKLINLGYSQIRLFIVGEGVLKPALLNQILKNQLESKVFLKGALSQEDIKKQFEQSDIFLLPGIADPETKQAEAQGLVIQEAQAMQLPVIVSDAGGMKYGLIPNETGFVIEENNIDSFVKHIEKLISNPDLKIKMGNKGAEFVKSNFDSKILINRLEEIYSK